MNIEVSSEGENSISIILPDGLHIAGCLTLIDQSEVLRVSETLNEGDFIIAEHYAMQFPDDLYIPGNVYILRSKLTFLPKNLRVDGDVYLTDGNIDSLPLGLCVGLQPAHVWAKPTLAPSRKKTFASTRPRVGETPEFQP